MLGWAEYSCMFEIWTPQGLSAGPPHICEIRVQRHYKGTTFNFQYDITFTAPIMIRTCCKTKRNWNVVAEAHHQSVFFAVRITSVCTPSTCQPVLLPCLWAASLNEKSLLSVVPHICSFFARNVVHCTSKLNPKQIVVFLVIEKKKTTTDSKWLPSPR